MKCDKRTWLDLAFSGVVTAVVILRELITNWKDYKLTGLK